MPRNRHYVSDEVLGRLSVVLWELTRRVKEGTLPADCVIEEVRALILQRKVDPDLYLARKAIARCPSPEDDVIRQREQYHLICGLASVGEFAAARAMIPDIGSEENEWNWHALAYARIGMRSKDQADFEMALLVVAGGEGSERDADLQMSILAEVAEDAAQAGDLVRARKIAKRLVAELHYIPAGEAYSAVLAVSGDNHDIKAAEKQVANLEA